MYQQNTTEIRIGMSMALISCMFFAPFVGVISAQMRRMENGDVTDVTAEALAEAV